MLTFNLYKNESQNKVCLNKNVLKFQAYAMNGCLEIFDEILFKNYAKNR